MSDLSAIAHRSLLAVGTANWDYCLDVRGASRSVRAIPKDGPQYRGCKESAFGTVHSWAIRVKRLPKDFDLTIVGHALVAEAFREMDAVGAAA